MFKNQALCQSKTVAAEVKTKETFEKHFMLSTFLHRRLVSFHATVAGRTSRAVRWPGVPPVQVACPPEESTTLCQGLPATAPSAPQKYGQAPAEDLT